MRAVVPRRRALWSAGRRRFNPPSCAIALAEPRSRKRVRGCDISEPVFSTLTRGWAEPLRTMPWYALVPTGHRHRGITTEGEIRVLHTAPHTAQNTVYSAKQGGIRNIDLWHRIRSIPPYAAFAVPHSVLRRETFVIGQHRGSPHCCKVHKRRPNSCLLRRVALLQLERSSARNY